MGIGENARSSLDRSLLAQAQLGWRMDCRVNAGVGAGEIMRLDLEVRFFVASDTRFSDLLNLPIFTVLLLPIVG